ncbi:hypothetical protein FRC17_005408 [Serendipita sp. 399]|nr:hypothetical protein FRC17_005408 [Serendipita sp. 399]
MKPNSVWWHEVVAMQSNREKLSLELQESYAHLVQSLVLYMDLRSPEALHSLGIDSAKDMVNLVSQFTINTFTLTSPLLDAIGITICPLAALINHSCDPNAVIVFPNSFKGIYPTLEILSVQPIKVGEEIVAAYVDITLPKALRQKSLNGTYAFDCKCSECTREVPLDLRESDSTRNCSKCGRSSVPPDDFVDKLKLANDGLEKVEKLQFQDPDYALSLATNVLGLISPFTPPSSHPRLALMRVLQTLSIEAMNTKNSAASTSVDSVIRLSAQIVAALVDLLPHGHPIRGVAIATLGRLLCVDEPEVPANVSPEQQQQAFPPRGYQRLALAKSTLLRALDELNVGFGSGGGILGTEMRHTLEGVDREMSVFERGVRNARESLKQTS